MKLGTLSTISPPKYPDSPGFICLWEKPNGMVSGKAMPGEIILPVQYGICPHDRHRYVYVITSFGKLGWMQERFLSEL